MTRRLIGLCLLVMCVSLYFLLTGAPLRSQSRGSASFLVQSTTPSFEVTLNKVEFDQYSTLSKWFQQPQWRDLRPYALLVRNNADLPITGITIRWEMTNSGKTEVATVSSDNYHSNIPNQEPILAPHEDAVTYPSGYIRSRTLLGGKGFIFAGTPPQSRLARLATSQVVVSLDTVIYADGHVIGPDRSQTVASLQSRKQVAESIVSTIRLGMSQNRDIRTLVNELAAPGGALSRANPLWASRYLSQLQSRDVTSFLEFLDHLPPLPVFFRN